MIDSGGVAMVQRARKASYQDLIDAPDDQIAELIDGDLVLSPRPRGRHLSVSTLLTSDLVDAFYRGRSGPGGWVIIFEPELHLRPDETVLVPDIAGWRKERLPQLPPDEVGTSVPPDWVCELLSPSTMRIDRLRKLPLYAEHAIPWLWLVDPLQRSLEIYRRDPEGYLLLGVHADMAKVRAPPFDAIELDLGSLWPIEQPNPG